MKTLALLLLTTLLLPVHGQNPGNSNSKQRQLIYIEFAATELNADAIHLALSSSGYSWTDNQDRADLIFHVDRTISKEHTQPKGAEINISISWQVELTAKSKDGKTIWQGTEPMDTTNHRTEPTEDGWIAFLRRTAEYKLTKKFLAAHPAP